MDAVGAIAAVRAYIGGAGMDYPADQLVADRFEAGWTVYAPVDVDTSDLVAFLQMPVGRAVFLIGDSGRIQQVSSSTPPRVFRQRFAETERRLARRAAVADPGDVAADVAAAFPTPAGDPSGAAAPGDAPALDAAVRQHTAEMLDEIGRELGVLGPPGWRRYDAVFAVTVRAEFARLEFETRDGWQPVQVPEAILGLVRAQRHTSAQLSSGPWWRLVMTVTGDGLLQADYDYGDEPFPVEQIQPAQHYRDDIDAYPRPVVPVWLAGYLAGPTAQGRSPVQAAAVSAADRAAGRVATASGDLGPLPEIWTRWAVLAAIFCGARSQWGPRIHAGVASFESDTRSGSSLYVLPGDRAVLSGGRWNSPLLTAAYHQHQPLPDLFTGAPEWVSDAVLNGRNHDGLLSFCYWWADGRWWRGRTEAVAELTDALPAVRSPQETLSATTAVVGPGVEGACQQLLAAVATRAASRDHLAAVFSQFADPDLDAAVDQLRVAQLGG